MERIAHLNANAELGKALQVVASQLHKINGLDDEQQQLISRVGDEIVYHTKPKPEVVEVVLATNGDAQLVLLEDQSWDEFPSLVPDNKTADPGRAILIGNTILLLTSAGDSRLTVYRTVAEAESAFEGLDEVHNAWVEKHEGYLVADEELPQHDDTGQHEQPVSE